MRACPRAADRLTHPTLPGSASMSRSMPSAETPRRRSRKPAPPSRRSHSTSPTAVIPTRPGAAPGWSDSSSPASPTWRNSARTSNATSKAGMKLSALDLAAAEHKRLEIFHRFRALFERFDILLTPAAPVKPYPVEMNFPGEINGRKLENYVDWIAPAFLDHAGEPACRQRARRQDSRWLASRAADRRAAVCGAAHPGRWPSWSSDCIR